MLPDDVAAGLLPPSTFDGRATQLSIGIDFATLGPARLEVPDGEHLLVVGPPRSGRTTALLRIVDGWIDAHGDGIVLVRSPRGGSPLLDVLDDVVVADELAIVAAVQSGRRALVVIDDAERVADAEGVLLDLVAERLPAVTVAAAGRPDALRTMYGHWTSTVRRSRLGLVMSGGIDTDGDLLGELLPRRAPLAPRPGLAWMIDAAGRRLVQIGRQPVAAVASAGSRLSRSRPSASRHDTRFPLLRIERE
jgi:S-DNA-T family DNA segregation ATPase FtsK/SpoIIIE